MQGNHNGRSEFHAQLERLHEVFGTRTQVQLAEVLEIQQSSVADAVKRRSLPLRWLLLALALKDIDPVWIMTGRGCRYRLPSELPRPMDVAALRQLHAEELLGRLRELLPGLEVRIADLERRRPNPETDRLCRAHRA
jgi:hypothetical protein